MARHADLPDSPAPVVLNKSDIFNTLRAIDNDQKARSRILDMEKEFRKRIAAHIGGLPSASSQLSKFNTNPFVLMFYSMQRKFSHVFEVEETLVPAKVFSSMETSAGNMIERVVLPFYGWNTVQSAMQTHESLLDGRKTSGGSKAFVGATLKSGPRTLNDDIARNIATEVVERASSWAVNAGATEVEFTYGTLYGTKRQSNKKDWHILRNIDELRPRPSTLLTPHAKNWSIAYQDGPLKVSATVRVGIEWWDYLSENAWIELCCALIRACIAPTTQPKPEHSYTISDLPDIIDTSPAGSDYNVSILQTSQLEWLLFLAQHFADELHP